MIVAALDHAVAHAPALHALAHAVLADDGSGDDTGESKKAGPIGIVVIILLCIGCYFLFKSMSKHLRRVREQFPAELPEDPLHPSAARTVATDTATDDQLTVDPATGSVATEPASNERPADAASGG